MKLDDYLKAAKSIMDKAKLEKDRIATAYARSNSPFIVGDTLEMNGMVIKVDKIRYSYGGKNETPICLYEGYLLTKNRNVRKDGKRMTFWQTQKITKVQ